ncbi:MAG: glycosyltransferase family 2 protein [Deltaproteobacteria bacterium]|nr:glycosyltransferase family 2 protein [Deltaproteobacteria bacterium]
MTIHNVKPVAVAKDEAPYLADWVFHHLFFGFDKIEIYVNRTSDNSIEILEEIKKTHPNVDYHLADWIDFLPGDSRKHLQQICYMHSVSQSADFKYVMFLDIDEFWLCSDFKTTINDFTRSMENKSFGSIYFEWFNEDAVDVAFSPILQTTRGKVDVLGKCLTRLPVSFKHVRLHVPKYENENAILLADESTFRSQGPGRRNQDVHASKSSLKDFFILHRMYRSNAEYLSSLYRGNPQLNFPIKLNRDGFGFPGHEKNVVEIKFPIDEYTVYQNKRDDFIVQNNLTKPIVESQNRIAANAQRLIDIIPECMAKKPNEVKNVLQRTNVVVSEKSEKKSLNKKMKSLRQVGTQLWKSLKSGISC